VTDYDCWHPEHDAVTVTQIIDNLMKNAAHACDMLVKAVERMPRERSCKCGSALEHAIITDRAMIPPDTRHRLELLIGKYL
jgi:5'-methylthioadenosine phosphorylase